MTMIAKIKRIRGSRIDSQETTGGARQPTVKSGRVEAGRDRLNHFAKRLRHAIMH